MVKAPPMTVLGDPGDPDAPVGSTPWALAMRLELLNTFQRRDDAENHLQRMRDWFMQNEGWRALADANGLLFPSWEAFCSAKPPYGLGTTAAHLDAEVERRELLTFEEAGRRGGRGRKSPSPGNGLYGNNAAYVLARLDRDRPELAARVRAGELKAKTAARQAGIVKTKTPLEQLHRLWAKTSPDDRLEFLRSIRVDDRE